MEKYDSYSETGVNWIPSIPDHWEKRSLRSFIRLFTEKGYGDAQLLSVTRERGVIERNKDDKEENHNFVPEDLSGYKHIMPGDFVINKMKSWQGSYGVSAFEGIVSPAYFTCKLSNVDKDFFSWAIRSKAYVPFFTQYSKGIRVDQWDLDPIALMKIPFFLPSPSEQKAIVEYLDRETQKINSFIAAKEKELALLDELKQAEIANAVTHGLNPDAPMKPSGISWLGDIPAHWEVRRLGRLAKFKTGTTPKFYDNDLKSETINWYTPGDFSDDFILNDSKRRLNKDEFEDNGGSYTPAGSVLIIGIGGTAGKVACTKSPCHMNQQITAILPNHDITPLFLMLYLRSLNKTLIETAPYTTLPILNNTFLSKILTILPSIEEQTEIVDYITRRYDKINAMISNIQTEIAHLKEYKQRLIADAVTGQIKVC